MKIKHLALLLVTLLVVALIGGSCALRLLVKESSGIWTPAPVSGAPLVSTRSAAILPSQTPLATTRLTPTPAPAVQPGAEPSPTSEPAPAPGSQPSPDPNLVIITEADVLRAIASGVAGQEGASLEGAGVEFADEKMVLSAARLTYGTIEVNNLLLVGRLTANEGQLRLETESISPRGLVTALIPTFANQMLAQYASQWYIEEVHTRDGQLELRVR